jgi:hypothetical protein
MLRYKEASKFSNAGSEPMTDVKMMQFSGLTLETRHVAMSKCPLKSPVLKAASYCRYWL